MSKRRKKRDKIEVYSLHLPHDRIVDIHRDKDPDGAIVMRAKVRSRWDRMLASKTINDEMKSAAEEFEKHFARAHLSTGRSMPLMPSASAHQELTITEQQEFYRRRVHKAMVVLGGSASVCGSIIWHVVGEQWSIREWAEKKGWLDPEQGPTAKEIAIAKAEGRKPQPTITHTKAQGVLVAALERLAFHYGFLKKGR